MRKLLITGGAGFIGSNFVHHWRRQHPTDVVVVLDALTCAGSRSTRAALDDSPPLHFVRGDIGDRSLVNELMRAHTIDTVVHFAAETHVDRSIQEADVFVRSNVLGTQVLLDAARQYWMTGGQWRDGVRFHHVSTDEVYGSLTLDDPPFSELTPYAPRSPYAASKAAADHLVRACAHTHGLPISISNCSNNYGPFQFPEKLIPLVLVNALRGHSLPLYGDGLHIRDWLFVEDHCRAIQRILEADVAGETFNIGARGNHTNLDVVRHLCTLLDQRFQEDPALARRYPGCPAATTDGHCADLITFVADRPGHDRRYAMDTSKITQRLRFAVTETLESGLATTVDWYLSNEAWWRAALG